MKNVVLNNGVEMSILGSGVSFASADEVDYETTGEGEPERGSVISQKSLATLITKIIESPEKYVSENPCVNKPGS